MSQEPPVEPDRVDPSQVDAAASGEAIDEGKGRVFPCEGCGADLVFHIGQQELKCPYCGFKKALTVEDGKEIREQDFLAMLEKLRERRVSGAAPLSSDAHEVHCSSCGAVVQFEGTLISTTCPYCGSPLQRDDVVEAEQRIPFDAVLPFQVDRQSARQRLRAWIRSRWFAPNAFKKHRVRTEFEGVYLPFWTFDSMTFTRYVGQRGEDYTVVVGSGKNRHTVTRTRWYPASGSFQRFFDDVLVPASTGVSRRDLDALAPWRLQQCIPFTQEAIAGFYARVYDVDLEQGFLEARQRMEAMIERDVRRRIGGDRQRIDSISTQYDAITYKQVLLPVWMLVYRFRGKPYQVLVNGSTGKIVGERPYSWVKIALAVLAGAALAGLLYWIAQWRAG